MFGDNLFTNVMFTLQTLYLYHVLPYSDPLLSSGSNVLLCLCFYFVLLPVSYEAGIR